MKKKDLGWHVISGEQILNMLYDVASGEHPDVIFMEMWANAEHRVESRVNPRKKKKGS